MLCHFDAGYSQEIVRRALKGVETVIVAIDRTLEKENRQL